MRTLGIIPARKGSKRLPGKHHMILGDKKLIDWTIDAAIASQLDMIILSTDDMSIFNHRKEVSEDTTRFSRVVRPKHLRGDDIHASQVVLDILESHYKNEIPYDVIMMLLPTSPFRTAGDIDEVLGMMESGKEHAVIGVQELSYPDIRLRYIDEWGYLEHPYYDSESVTKNSQECPQLYLVNGAIFAAKPGLLLTDRTFHVACAFPYIMPPGRGIEIDTPEDLALARGMCAEDER